MKLTSLVFGILGLCCANVALAAEPETAPAPAPTVEKLLSYSPDNEFAMRVRYDTSGGPTDEGAPGTVQAIDLVVVSTGAVAATLLPFDEAGMNFRDVQLVWSEDSNWVAFYYAYPRVGYTTVLRRQANKFFETVKPETLMTDATAEVENPGGVRNEYISPKRWKKPGTLLLQQFSVVRQPKGKSAGVKYDLTAVFKSDTGKLKTLTAVKRSD